MAVLEPNLNGTYLARCILILFLIILIMAGCCYKVIYDKRKEAQVYADSQPTANP